MIEQDKRKGTKQEEKHSVIYLDETWANAQDGKDNGWKMTQ